MCKVVLLHSTYVLFEQLIFTFFIFFFLLWAIFHSHSRPLPSWEVSSSSAIHWNDIVAGNTTSHGCLHKWINPISAQHLPNVSKTASVKCEDGRWVLLSCWSICQAFPTSGWCWKPEDGPMSECLSARCRAAVGFDWHLVGPLSVYPSGHCWADGGLVGIQVVIRRRPAVSMPIVSLSGRRRLG